MGFKEKNTWSLEGVLSSVPTLVGQKLPLDPLRHKPHTGEFTKWQLVHGLFIWKSLRTVLGTEEQDQSDAQAHACVGEQMCKPVTGMHCC